MSLSGGEKQRVAVATAIASERSVLLFDEPTSGLDYRHMLQVARLFEKLRNHGKTILVVTHDLEFIEASIKLQLHHHPLNIHSTAFSFQSIV